MKTRQHGAALIELALILPLLMILTVITTEFGRAMYEYNTLTKSLRDAVRYSSMQTPGTQMSEARSLVVYGNLTSTGTPLALGLSMANVPNPTWQTLGAAPVINTVTMRVVNYTFRPMFASVFGLNIGNITYGEITATMRAPL